MLNLKCVGMFRHAQNPVAIYFIKTDGFLKTMINGSSQKTECQN